MPQQNARPSAWYVERQLLTRSPATPALPTDKSSNYSYGQVAPPVGTTNPGDGLVIAGLFAIVISVYANPGTTFTSGSLLCWIYNPYQEQWTRAPAFDIDLSLAASMNAYTYGSLLNISRLGMNMNWAASSVVTSAGTDILLRLDGFTSTGERGT